MTFRTDGREHELTLLEGLKDLSECKKECSKKSRVDCAAVLFEEAYVYEYFDYDEPSKCTLSRELPVNANASEAFGRHVVKCEGA